MGKPMEFTVTEGHIRLLGRTYVEWLDYAYDGSPGVNPKRPFGNSDVLRDIEEEVNPDSVDWDDEDWDDWYESPARHAELKAIFREMDVVIQIALYLAGNGQLLQPGKYRRPVMFDTTQWERQEG